MSLDVYLMLANAANEVNERCIAIREDGQVKMLTRAEWYERHPGIEPFVAPEDDADTEVYWANITHNLGGMAAVAGIYRHLWRPDELGVTLAAELILPLRTGLELLTSDPDRFIPFNPPNGWGDYDGLVRFVSKYLAACEKYPQATVRVSR